MSKTQFRLDNFTQIKGRTINIRSENHGAEHVPAIDWGVTMDVPNTQLALLGSELLGMLYKSADVPEEASAQSALDGIEPVSQLPLLRSHNFLMPLKLTNEYVGYQLTVDSGLGGKSNLVLQECKVNKFTLDCKEGGSVMIHFRIQASNVGEDVRGRLSSYIKGATTSIALSPPEMKQEAIDGTTGHPGAIANAAAKGGKGKQAPTGCPKCGNEDCDTDKLDGTRECLECGHTWRDPARMEAGDAFAAAEAAGKNKPAAKTARKGRAAAGVA